MARARADNFDHSRAGHSTRRMSARASAEPPCEARSAGGSRSSRVGPHALPVGAPVGERSRALVCAQARVRPRWCTLPAARPATAHARHARPTRHVAARREATRGPPCEQAMCARVEVQSTTSDVEAGVVGTLSTHAGVRSVNAAVTARRSARTGACVCMRAPATSDLHVLTDASTCA